MSEFFSPSTTNARKAEIEAMLTSFGQQASTNRQRKTLKVVQNSVGNISCDPPTEGRVETVPGLCRADEQPVRGHVRPQHPRERHPAAVGRHPGQRARGDQVDVAELPRGPLQVGTALHPQQAHEAGMPISAVVVYQCDSRFTGNYVRQNSGSFHRYE